MVVSWLPFSQKRSRSFYTIQSRVHPFIVSGGWWPSHPKPFWNWSHHWLGNGACFSSVTLWRASTGKAGHRGQGWMLRPGCHSWARCIPLHSHISLTQLSPPLCSWQVQAAAQAQKKLETAKMPWLPTLLRLSKERLAFAVRRSTGEGENRPTIARHPVSCFLWGQEGSSRHAHMFSPT